MELLVVGAGEMGTWVARTASAYWEDDLDVAFVDSDPDVAASAAGTLDGRTVPTDTEERFDAVCVAVPIPAVEDAIATYADNATAATLDVSGVMSDPVVAMRDHAPDCERVSLHPLFSATNAPGRVAVVADAAGPTTDEFGVALAAAGNDLFETTVAEHDRAMETIQARAHAAVLAFGLAADDVPEPFRTPVSRQLFAALDSVVGDTPRVYADIQAAFEGAADVAEYADRLAEADRETFTRLYRQASRNRPETTDTGRDSDGTGR
jgi:prephenate dehydrogenase